MLISYDPILVLQLVLSIIYIIVKRKKLNYISYMKILIVNFIIFIFGLYSFPFPITASEIHLFAVTPNLIPFGDVRLNTVGICYLIAPIIILTILNCTIMKKSKALFLAFAVSLVVQFLAYAMLSQRAEITFIIIQVIGAIIGVGLYIQISECNKYKLSE